MESLTVRLLLTVALLMDPVLGTCRFPETLYGTKVAWKTQSEDGSPNLEVYRRREMTVSGSDMTVKYLTSKYPETVNTTKVYRCQQEVEPGSVYVVSVHEPGRDTLYTCVKFLVRNTNVVQWKMAPLTRHNVSADRLCFMGGSEERLKLVDSPFIYYDRNMWSEPRNRYKPYLACPLDGGYVVTGWRDETGKGHCDSSKLPMMKLENECEKGEGLVMTEEEEDACPFPGNRLWRLYCSATWTEGPWTFMYAVDAYSSTVDDLVCLRYPTQHGASFTLDIFRDSVCDSSEGLERSLSRYHVDLVNYPAPSMCADRYPNCERLQNLTRCRDYKTAENCPTTCRACPSGDIFTDQNATFPDNLIGTWLKDTSKQGKETVTIDATSIDIPSLGRYKLLGKSDCRGLTGFAGVSGEEYVLLQTFDNGCSPRSTTMALASRSPAVLNLRINHPEIVEMDVDITDRSKNATFWWQLSDSKYMWCPNSRNDLPMRTQMEAFRASQFGWFTLVDASSDAQTVSCRVPSASLDIRTNNGTTCKASLSQSTPDSFQVTFAKCNGTGVQTHTPEPVQFTCLGDYSGVAGRHFLITRTARGGGSIVQEEFMCWVFTVPTRNILYWMRLSECDIQTELFVERKIRKDIATIDYQLLSVSDGSCIQRSIAALVFAIFTKLIFI